MARKVCLEAVFASAVVTMMSVASPAAAAIVVGKPVEIGTGNLPWAAPVGENALVAYNGTDGHVRVKVGPFPSSTGSLHGGRMASINMAPAACAITDTKYVSVWLEPDSYKVAAMLNSDYSNPTFKKISVGNSDPNVSQGPRVACTRSGFTVTWIDGVTLRAQWYNADGAKLGGSIIVQQDSFDFTPTVATLATGRLLLVWQGSNTTPANVWYYRMYFENRTAVGPVQTFPDMAACFTVSLATLDDGGWVLAYPKTTIPGRAVAYRFDSNGVRSEQPIFDQITYNAPIVGSVGESIIIFTRTRTIVRPNSTPIVLAKYGIFGLWVNGGSRNKFEVVNINTLHNAQEVLEPSVATLADGRIFVVASVVYKNATSALHGWYVSSSPTDAPATTPAPTTGAPVTPAPKTGSPATTPAPTTGAPVTPVPTTDPSGTPVPSTTDAPATSQPVPAPSSGNGSWLHGGYIALLVLVLAGIMGAGFWYFRRRRRLDFMLYENGLELEKEQEAINVAS